MAEHNTGKKFIKIRGANVNNLKNLSVDTVSYTHLYSNDDSKNHYRKWG